MKKPSGKLGIAVTPTLGIGYQLPDSPSCFIPVGRRLLPQQARDLGIKNGLLTEKHVEFFLLLILDLLGELGPNQTRRKPVPQRLRIAEYVGLSIDALRKRLVRLLAQHSGRVLRWDHLPANRQASRTGGPWLLDVRETAVIPDLDTGKTFLESQRVRNSDPPGLLGEALRAREAEQWVRAFELLELAEATFRRRRWPRETPLRFEIFLELARTEMQLGRPGLMPKRPINITRSVANLKHRLDGPSADLILARAHYIASLVCSQRDEPSAKADALEHVERAIELLKGRVDAPAVQEYWRVCAEKELVLARRTGSIPSKRSSAILQASRVIEGSTEQKRMSYGESLLLAGRPVEAIDYIRPAIDSGRLSQRAWVIAERLDATARYQTGGKPSRTVEVLRRVEEKAESLGFDHQARVTRRAIARVRQGRRKARKT